MRKKVFITPGNKQAALAVIGWTCFILGCFTEDKQTDTHKRTDTHNSTSRLN